MYSTENRLNQMVSICKYEIESISVISRKIVKKFYLLIWSKHEIPKSILCPTI